MSHGFIKLQRKIQNHWIYQEKRKFSKYEAWLDMLMLANHKPNKFVLGNELIELEKGQFVTSVRKLGERWEWSNTKVTQFLDLLKADEMIDFKKDTKKTVVTVANYGFYHDYETQEKTQDEHEKDTKRTQKHTNKNVKNDKNEKEKNNIPLQIENLRKRYSTDQLKVIDNFLDIIRHTRASGKIQDTVILKMYEDWDKHPIICVEYALNTYVNSPNLHSKKENYVLGIIRNTTSDEAQQKLLKVNPGEVERAKVEPSIKSLRNRKRDLELELSGGIEGFELIGMPHLFKKYTDELREVDERLRSFEETD